MTDDATTADLRGLRATACPDPRATRWRFRAALRSGLRSALRAACGALLVLAAWSGATANPVGAQSTGSPTCDTRDRVRAIEFVGSEVPEDELSLGIATQGPGLRVRLLRWGTPPCSDSLEVVRDALRIAVLHRQHGWFQATVTPRFDRRSNGVRLLFEVRPGPIARIDSVAVTGMPPVPPGRRPFAEPLLALRGQAFDRQRVQNAVNTTVNRMQNVGYGRARQPERTLVIDSANAKVMLSYDFTPGPRLRVGEVRIDVSPVEGRDTRYSAATVSGLVGLREGERYDASELNDAQRALRRTEAFSLALVDTVAPPADRADSTIDIQVTVAEARIRSARVGAGWGTLECGRVQGRVTDRGFLGPGRRVELTTRASRLGIGAPLDNLPSICPQFLRDDPFSAELNYFVGLSLSNSSFFGLDFSPTVNLYSERRGEPYAFQREVDIGASFGLARSLGVQTFASTSVQYELGRTVTDPVLACVRFALCQPSDFALAAPGNSTTALNTTLVHDRAIGVVDPRYGGRVRLDSRLGRVRFALLEELESGAGTYGFFRPTVEVAGFTRVGNGTLAARVQWSQVYAPGAPTLLGSPLLPQQERLFSGGENTVRGYQQNLLGPVVYRVDRAAVDSVPVNGTFRLQVRDEAAARFVSPEGGTGTLIGNLEFRVRPNWPSRDLQYVLFLDAGTVWATGVAAFSPAEVRATPGVGLRLDTPLGPFRVDIGYNPRTTNAGKALLIDEFRGPNDTEPRPYIICVSPGQETTFEQQLETGGLVCPRTFQPTGGRSALSRLVFHFSLGQAF